MENWRQCRTSLTARLEEAVAILEKNQCAGVVDEHSRLLGTLTDRDVRKSLLRHQPLNIVTACMNKEPTNFQIPGITSKCWIHQKSGFEQYPIVDWFVWTLHKRIAQQKIEESNRFDGRWDGSRLAASYQALPQTSSENW